MNHEEAIAALMRGQAIRHESWPPFDHYAVWGGSLFFVSGDTAIDRMTDAETAARRKVSEVATGWEIYSPPTIH